MSELIRFRTDAPISTGDRDILVTSASLAGGSVFAILQTPMVPVAAPVQQSLGAIVMVAQEAHESLMAELRDLRARVSVLEAARAAEAPLDTEVRIISDRQAKTEISRFFCEHDGEKIYPSDVASALGMDYDQVTNLMHRLAAEGKIAPAR